MITLVNFADKKFKKKRNWSSFTAKLFGKVNKVIKYGPEDIDKAYIEKNKESVKYRDKGFGNYFWKPFIVNKALNEINDGEYLFYADSGTLFIKTVVPLIKHMEKQEKNIMCFRLPLIEKQWTKRDAFLLMDCDKAYYKDSTQIMGGFIILKKCKESMEFINQWIKFSSDNRILSDDENVMGKSNDREFIAHRHDQSVLSLLSKKHSNVLIEGDITDYGCFPYRYINNLNNMDKKCLYDKNIINNPEINAFRGTILLNRKNDPVIYFCKYLVRQILFKIGIRK
ncbi:galactosyl transferase GMA12/MNN10 family protein [Mariniflexile fucanivorans]|uniref:Galactosyl transferase GMA12/MNN10 family protein n=1 Tax=Mariniflexile fucanivorans TaxID=264023 RepID=A0A4R1RS98_9FLAO|nr:hypothetical protein [Mariniflexile fucanivorans]TCL69236.1 galactosyl transferase GMA12/MNN10 family protein [Mariniflexile fucanivorans]